MIAELLDTLAPDERITIMRRHHGVMVVAEVQDCGQRVSYVHHCGPVVRSAADHVLYYAIEKSLEGVRRARDKHVTEYGARRFAEKFG